MEEELLDSRTPETTDNATAVPSIAQLADKLYHKRKGRELTLGQAAQQIGVSAATLSRIERQRPGGTSTGGGGPSFVPDTRTIAAITQWLDDQPGPVMRDESGGLILPSQQPEESVPDIVEVYLRADPKLDSEASLALAQMFRMAYDQFSRLGQGKTEGKASNEHGTVL